MVRSLDEMVSVGTAKMTRKAAAMSSSWNAAKTRMKTGYGAMPFGPTRKTNYGSGIDAATHRVDVDKWARNWRANPDITGAERCLSSLSIPSQLMPNTYD